MSHQRQAGGNEEGVEVPYDQINQETLRRLIQEFVTRDGADWGDAGGSLDEKVDQVLQQLRRREVVVVFDLSSQTANIVCRPPGQTRGGSGQS